MFSSLSKFDLYPKLQDDLRVRTVSGAIVSLAALFCIFILFISELSIYLTKDTVDNLFVDVSRGEKLKINFNVTFPKIPCSLISIDAMDVSGNHQIDVSHHILKTPLDSEGKPLGTKFVEELGGTLKPEDLKKDQEEKADDKPKDPTKVPGYCGSCYGAEEKPDQCCNTCDEVREAYRARGWALGSLSNIEQCAAAGITQETLLAGMRRKEGCELTGYLEVNRVAGNFHFAPGKSYTHSHMHIHDVASFGGVNFDVSHKINSLSFGDPYPGIVNPLDGASKKIEGEYETGMFMYYNKVVPTSYEFLNGTKVDTNQFSVTEHFRPVAHGHIGGLPGVFFYYDLSPIMVKFTEQRKNFFHFMTQLCAILGGVYTIFSLLDKAVYRFSNKKVL